MDSAVIRCRQSKGMIDVLKLIMAICVIAIHTHPFANFALPYTVQVTYDTFILLAVPFFFLASGYFLGTKLQYPYPRETDIPIVVNYLKKTIKLYLIWTLAYFPLAFAHAIDNKTHPIKFVLLYIRGVFLIGENYNSWILWYLLSTVYALNLILFLLKRRFSLVQTALIGCLIILISFGFDCLSVYPGELPSILAIFKTLLQYSIANGRILRGMFFIPLGMLLAHKKLTPMFSRSVFLLCFVANCITPNELFSWFLGILSSISLFAIADSIPLNSSRIYTYIRKTSTVFYFTHLYVWSIYYTLVYGEKTFGLDSFVFTVLGCTFFAWLYLALNRQKIGRSIG